jgi:hypothetical protein
MRLSSEEDNWYVLCMHHHDKCRRKAFQPIDSFAPTNSLGSPWNNEGKAAHLKSVVHKECKDVNLDSG